MGGGGRQQLGKVSGHRSQPEVDLLSKRPAPQQLGGQPVRIGDDAESASGTHCVRAAPPAIARRSAGGGCTARLPRAAPWPRSSRSRLSQFSKLAAAELVSSPQLMSTTSRVRARSSGAAFSSHSVRRRSISGNEIGTRWKPRTGKSRPSTSREPESFFSALVAEATARSSVSTRRNRSRPSGAAAATQSAEHGPLSVRQERQVAHEV